MTKAQYLARKMALRILRAYHYQIKSVNVVDSSAVERERGQAAAFEEAEKQIREIFADGFSHCCGGIISDEFAKEIFDSKSERDDV